MEKPKKLKRYNRKDYTQLVDFPVEIVGRDGVVRHYSFEASVRLYQRRIASASNRYQDGDVVDAEVQHCQRRIDQLRKSYFQRYGWAAIRDGRGRPALSGPLAGEVAAFLHRFFGEQVHPDTLTITRVAEDGALRTYFLQGVGGDVRYLLYVYALDNSGTCAAREAFFDYLRALRPLRGDQVESLLAFHHTADCGLILTGAGDLDAARRAWEQREAEPAEEDEPSAPDAPAARPDGYAEGVRLLADGEPEAALARFEEGLATPPFLRPLAVAVVLVADLLGQPERSELAALLGAHYLPDDPVFCYHLGLARVRQRRVEEARAPLERGLGLAPGCFPLLYLGAMLAVRAGDMGRAAELVGRARGALRPDDQELRLSVRLAELALRWRGALGVAGVVLLALGAGLWWFAGLVGAAVWALGGLVLGLRVGADAVLAGLSSDRRLRGLALAPPELLGGGGPRLDELLV